MNTKMIAVGAVAASSLLFGSVARAQGTADEAGRQAGGRGNAPPPADRAVELKVDTGYAQGFGNVASGRPSLTDVGSAGGAVEIGAGYRFNPNFMLGLYGTGATFSRGSAVDSTTNLYAATAGIEANWHFLPRLELDPWVGLSSGWRGYWANSNAGTLSEHGLQIVRLQVGLDYRIDQAVAVSPVIGADLSTLVTEQTPGQTGWHDIQSPNVNTFLFAGIMGRFDIPTASSSGRVASR